MIRPHVPVGGTRTSGDRTAGYSSHSGLTWDPFIGPRRSGCWPGCLLMFETLDGLPSSAGRRLSLGHSPNTRRFPVIEALSRHTAEVVPLPHLTSLRLCNRPDDAILPTRCAFAWTRCAPLPVIWGRVWGPTPGVRSASPGCPSASRSSSGSTLPVDGPY